MCDFIGRPVRFQTGPNAWGEGNVNGYDEPTDIVTVLDYQGGDWVGSLDKVEFVDEEPGQDLWFYEPGNSIAQDWGRFDEQKKQYVSAYGNQTIAEMREERPDVMLLPWDEVARGINDACRTAPCYVSPSEFDSALNVLPPEGWVNNGDTESFKMSERTAGLMTGIYVRIGKDHFHFTDRCTLSHDEILSIVNKVKDELIKSRRDAEKLIYRHTHYDYKGKHGILTERGIVALEELTTSEIESRLPSAIRREQERLGDKAFR